jgi:hypothetical protein
MSISHAPEDHIDNEVVNYNYLKDANLPATVSVPARWRLYDKVKNNFARFVEDCKEGCGLHTP